MSEDTPIKVKITKAYCGMWVKVGDYWHTCSADRAREDIERVDHIFQCFECRELDLEVGE